MRVAVGAVTPPCSASAPLWQAPSSGGFERLKLRQRQLAGLRALRRAAACAARRAEEARDRVFDGGVR